MQWVIHRNPPLAVGHVSHVKICKYTWRETLFPSMCLLTADRWRSEQVNDFTLHPPDMPPIESVNVVMLIELRCHGWHTDWRPNPIKHNVATRDAIENECVWFIWLMSYFNAQVAFFCFPFCPTRRSFSGGLRELKTSLTFSGLYHPSPACSRGQWLIHGLKTA